METLSHWEVPSVLLSSDGCNLLAFEDVGDELLLRDAEELLAPFAKKKLPLSGTERYERYCKRQKSERERLKEEVVVLTKRLEAQMKQQGPNELLALSLRQSVSTWRIIAMKEKRNRLVAEAWQNQFRGAVADQAALIIDLQDMISRRMRWGKRDNVEKLLSLTQTEALFYSGNAMLIEACLGELTNVYRETDRVFHSCASSVAPLGGFNTVMKDNGDVEFFEIADVKHLPCDYQSIENACRINGIQIDDASRGAHVGDFREHVLQHFEASNYQSVFREKLQRLKQTAEIETYNGEYSALIFRVEGMTVLDQVLCYANGLKPRTRSYVKLENPETLSEAMDLAVKSVAVVYQILDEFDRILGMLFFEDMQPQIDWRSRRIEGKRTKTLHWKRTGETCKPIEEGGPVIASGLRRYVEAKGLSAKRPDSCRGAALETDVKLTVEAVGDAVQKEKTPSVVRGQQVDAQAGKGSAGLDDVATSKRASTTRAADESSGTRGKDTVVEKMFTMGIVDESGVQTKFITRKKLRKFLRIKTKKIDEPDFMLVLLNETIKQVARSLQRRDEPDNVGSAKAQRYLETDWDTFRENPAFDLLTEYKDNVFLPELPEGLPEKREHEHRIDVKDPNLAMYRHQWR
ncbi:uncharacterized protein IUM83_19466 [Phytophthora cinnamomi]|uniref:uncharacterized protein n=1 Tax=Phytophthora cinnamomi TaxID=4785 RepID=UPI00355A1AF4|nr:hypothetical protein IUM83_19466 [Phytophthora cinnamomi]